MAATGIAIRPMEWAPLEDIDDVEPIGDHDAGCLEEVYRVLRRHNKHERFGITLLHRHFDMDDDEVLLERTDPDSRVLTLRPAKSGTPEVARSMQTSWMLTADGEGRTMTWCQRHCVRNIHGNHEMGGHYQTG